MEEKKMFRTIKNFFMNVWKYKNLLATDYDFDYRFLLNMIATKLYYMEKFFKEEGMNASKEYIDTIHSVRKNLANFIKMEDEGFDDISDEFKKLLVYKDVELDDLKHFIDKEKESLYDDIEKYLKSVNLDILDTFLSKEANKFPAEIKQKIEKYWELTTKEAQHSEEIGEQYLEDFINGFKENFKKWWD